MTDEQKKLVEENHALIYQVIRDMGLPIEEHYGIGIACLSGLLT